MNPKERRAATSTIQTRLAALGLYGGHVDGLWGPMTIGGVGGALDRLEAATAPPSAGGALVGIDARAALEIGFHEAIVRQAYRDGGGVWTWSVGLTSATGHDVERYINNPQTIQYCLDVYAWRCVASP